MNNIYLYNNDLISLLSLIKVLLKNKIKPDNIKVIDYNKNLFDNLINLNIKKDNNIINEFIKIFGINNFKTIYYIYISKEDNKELIIYYYLLNYFKYKEKLTYMRNLKCVSKALEIRKKVGSEAHKMKGFVRFRELSNKVLFADINPDNDILYLLSIHFKNRLKNEYWLIHDVNRHTISIYDKKDFYIISDKDLEIVDNISDREEEFANLWQTFYQTIGISERHNERCRMNFMPRKYWPYLLEVRDEL